MKPMTPFDPTRRADALSAVRVLLRYLGEDPGRAGLQDTPERFLRAWERDWGSGYLPKDPSELVKMFPLSDTTAPGVPPYQQMVLVRDLSFYSTCEHHLAPFFGTAHIAYLPVAAGVVGLSKMARVVDYFSRRLQVQERLTEEIAGFLAEHVSPHIAVTMNAAHLCMVSRGVRQPNARTVTTALRGIFLKEPSAQQEFLRKTES